MKRLTKKYFQNMDAVNKGYAVYMFGCRKDQPNIPKAFQPTVEDEEQYNYGKFLGILEAQEIDD